MADSRPSKGSTSSSGSPSPLGYQVQGSARFDLGKNRPGGADPEAMRNKVQLKKQENKSFHSSFLDPAVEQRPS